MSISRRTLALSRAACCGLGSLFLSTQVLGFPWLASFAGAVAAACLCLVLVGGKP